VVNPLARLAWRDASLILVQNEETRQWFPARYRPKCRHFQHVVLEESDEGGPTTTRTPRTAIFVGRLLPWKGLALALDALALAPDWRLVVCGSGPDESRLAALVQRKRLGSRVAFLGWQPREEVFRLMREAELLLFPSLHDDAGFTVLEAMVAGLPVLCLDRVGPPALAGPAALAVDASRSPRAVVTALAHAMELRRFPSGMTVRKRAALFLFSSRVEQLRAELERGGMGSTEAWSDENRPGRELSASHRPWKWCRAHRELSQGPR
jgi:glycosyltransferase involved in cell wall biosynthesis